MNSLLERGRRLGMIAAGLLLSIICIAGAYLAFPGVPAKSATLKFDGFIKLPAMGVLSALDYLAIEDGKLFVSSLSSGRVVVTGLDPIAPAKPAAICSTAAGGSAHGVVLIRRLHLGLVTRSGLNTVDIFNLDTLQLVKRLAVAEGPDAILHDPETGLVYVANADAKMATLIDPGQQKVVATIPLPGQPEYAALDARSGLLYQNIENTSSVAAISITRRAVVNRWPLASCQGPSGMALDARRQRLFVVCSGNQRLGIYGLATHRLIASLPVGRLSDSAAFDPALDRVYVAGGAGQLTVIGPNGADSYRVVDRIRTHLGAHTLAVDLSSHRLYVGYAGFATRARVAVFSPRNMTSRPAEGGSE